MQPHTQILTKPDATTHKLTLTQNSTLFQNSTLSQNFILTQNLSLTQNSTLTENLTLTQNSTLTQIYFADRGARGFIIKTLFLWAFLVIVLVTYYFLNKSNKIYYY